MGGKSKAKKANQKPKPPVQDVVPTRRVSLDKNPYKEESKGQAAPAKESEFTKVVGLRDPRKGEKEGVKMPLKKNDSDRGLTVAVREGEKRNQDNFAARISALRKRLERRENRARKYHRGNVANRPRGTTKGKERRPSYLDRMSRLGSVDGKRGPKKKRAGVKREKVMVFTPNELYGKKEAEQLAKLDAKKKKPKKKEGN